MSAVGDVRRDYCPTCGGTRNCEIMALYEEKGSDADEAIWFQTDHLILKCRGCDEIFHLTDHVFSEDVVYTYGPDGEEDYDYKHTIRQWPSPLKRERPDFITQLALADDDLRSLMDSAYVALDHDLHVLAAIGLRTAFDRATELLKVHPALGFGEKLDELTTSGWIGTSERDALSALTDAGSAAAHRGWKPSVQQLDTMASIIESFLHRNFVLNPAAAQHLTGKVPPKPKRPPKPKAKP